MSKYRNSLPQMSGKRCLTDGGLETTMIYHHGIDLPHFASFDLMRTEKGVEAIKSYMRPYVETAVDNELGFVLETPTWRASADWGSKFGLDAEQLASVNKQSIEMLLEFRSDYETAQSPMVISGCLGPRYDGYHAKNTMTALQAKDYHLPQIQTFEAAGADVVTALTIPSIDEAIGLTLASQKAGIPIVISFTVETDGRIPAGNTLAHAIRTVDRATRQGPEYYMINCAHPTHFMQALAGNWTNRIRGIRANASKLSHDERHRSTGLDEGDPYELATYYTTVQDLLAELTVMGGCCGTDHRHVAEIAKTYT